MKPISCLPTYKCHSCLRIKVQQTLGQRRKRMARCVRVPVPVSRLARRRRLSGVCCQKLGSRCYPKGRNESNFAQSKCLQISARMWRI
ncbi:unnamed protein product [Musa banksii]